MTKAWNPYRNMGAIDRSLRLLFGSTLLAAWAFLNVPTGQSWIFGVLAVVNLVTGISGFCPLYVPFGLSTVRKKTTELHQSPR